MFIDAIAITLVYFENDYAETHVPTEKTTPQQGPRFFASHEESRWPTHDRAAKAKRQGAFNAARRQVARMLPRLNRLRNSGDFNRVYEGGRSASGPWFVARFLRRPSGQPKRIGIVVGTKISKRATERNAIRRRIREAARATGLVQGTGLDIVIIARQPVRGKTYQEIVSGMRQLANKLRPTRPTTPQ